MASILVVDDDIDILKIASEILSSSGHFVFVAEDAQEALDHLNQRSFDLIITDANMPRHSGYDLLATLKQNKNHKDIPVAFLTGRREKEDIQRAVAMGASDYIIKPIDPFLLTQKINQILSQNKKHVASVEIAKTNVSNKAFLRLPSVILTLSEVGMEVMSEERLHDGRNIKLDTAIFKEIGIQEPFMKVLNCSKNEENGKYHVKLQFIGMKEQDLQKIRAWMLQGAKKHSA
tara:strand:+ start:6166 stop:6861 length:696 start_codon:yes stop_codon:yes gene_type:complete